MIRINLLPEELKIKAKFKSPEQETVKKVSVLLQDKVFIYIIVSVLTLFILAHFYFVIISISKNSKLVSLNRKWLDSAAQKNELDEFNRQFSSGSQNISLLKELLARRILWAQKLNALSLDLPSGVWFNSIVINDKNITIQGSVISLQKQEVSLINKLLENLKADTGFSKNFFSLELSNVQKRVSGGYDISDFTLTGVLKS